MQALRKQMRAAGATVQVAKNRLVKIALRGTDAASISELMGGPTLIAYSDDPIAAPKAAVAFAKNHDKLVILGGAMGATALNVDAVRSLANCAARSLASSRHRRRGSRGLQPRRPPSSRAFSRPTPERMPPPDTFILCDLHAFWI
jgi:hypothetical protein